MNQKTLERLEYLRKRNSDKHWVNHDLYRLMYREDLYILAYERLKSKPGNYGKEVMEKHWTASLTKRSDHH